MLKLKELRLDKQITQAELSKALQISASAIGMYEQGRRQPDYATLSKIASYFNVTTDYLLGLSDQPGGFQKGDGCEGQMAGTLNGGWQDMSLDDDEDSLDAESQKLLADYRQLDEKARETIKNMIEISLRKKAPIDD